MYLTLHTGTRIPQVGLGTYKLRGDDVERIVRAALEEGYRHIDTAAFYRNEEGIGRALRDSGLRDQVFLTTKCWNDDLQAGRVLEALDESLERLGLPWVDLYLVHWPVGDLRANWQAMEEAVARGKARAIGVSNFLETHLDALDGLTVPAVNQLELHPWCAIPELRARCQRDGIVVQAWSPLMQGRMTEEPVITEIAEEVGRTPGQVTLRWSVQHGAVVLPKTRKPHRLAENAALFDFELTEDQMARLDALPQQRQGPDPARFGF